MPVHLIHLRDIRWDLGDDILTPAERGRADRFVHDVDRLRYVRLRLFTRLHLASTYGVEPGDVEVGTAPCAFCGSESHGAPIATIGTQSITLSLTQSGDVGGLLVGPHYPVGLDIEHLFEPSLFDAVRGVLSVAETSTLADSHQLEDPATLTRAWTRKEAVLKAIGVGFLIDPQSVDVRAEIDGRVVARCSAPGWEGDWDVHSLHRGSLHVAGAFRHPTVGRLWCIDHGVNEVELAGLSRAATQPGL